MPWIHAFAPTLPTLFARARAAGLDPAERVQALVRAHAIAAERVFGSDLPVEVAFDEAGERVAATAVRRVGDGPGEVSVEAVTGALGPGFSEGDEVLVDLEFFDPPTWSLLGLSDPEATRRRWTIECGRMRLEAFPEGHAASPELVGELSAEVGDEPALPSLEWSLRALSRWLEERAPAARKHYGGAPAEDVRATRELGEAGEELARLLEVLGPASPEPSPPLFRGAPLLTPEQSRSLRAMLDDLEAGGDFARWEPGEWWNPGWVPFLGDEVGAVCVDLRGWATDRPGQIVGWANDDPARPIQAPSLGAWVGLQVLGVLAGLQVWSDEDGIDTPLDASVGLQALRERVLPGFPEEWKAAERTPCAS